MTDTPDTPAGKSHRRIAVSLGTGPRDLMEEPLRIKGAWTAKVITLFPEAFPGTLGLSLTGKALDFGLWALDPIDLRSFGAGKHRNVDDTPAGGGAGLVLRADILDRALKMAALNTPADRSKWPVVYLSPRGTPFTQARAQQWAQGTGITLLCGRFEGVDQRVLDHHSIEEASLGDFVLTGGEIAAQAMLDATVRLIPGVLGNQTSTEEESFSNGLLEHPHYTKPALWQDLPIPDVLLSGHHGDIANWRQAQSEALTKTRRPDLWQAYQLGKTPKS